ncbi:hypothetical protein IGL98_000658 [Enterococcus sp. DIV0840]|uniref:hypothetical protein n=1 Tax=Enterococcus TaxID=1350 RepID=UPI001A8C633D|nr:MULTISPECIES: hypothetical protein [Enterococcus]MBO0434610.1 hypothetical protein [Enterococcus sp. DIV0849a]MBO0472172.1 hypothetical protein [Enterococcus ureasiticus]
MKKNIFLSLAIFIVIIGLLVIAFKNPVNKSYEIKEAGYTYSPKGEVVKFSNQAKYNNTWINNERVIEDNSKKKSIDVSRTLFLENKEIQFLGKSVAVISNEKLDELPSFTFLKEEATNYVVKTQENKTISSLPKGTMMKLADGRYMILDSANLQNKDGLNKKLKDNSIVIIDKNNKVRINGDGKTEEVSSSDLYISMENSRYRFDLNTEQLINPTDEKDTIDVKQIKIDINDEAEKRNDLLSNSEAKTDESTEKSSESSSKQPESSTLNNTETPDNISNGQADNGTNNTSNNPGNTSTNNGNGNTNNDPNALTDEQTENINDVIKKLNELEKNEKFEVPIISIEAKGVKQSIQGKLLINDQSERLKNLEISLLSNGTIVEKQDIQTTEQTHDFSFENLHYGNTYQLIVEGSYFYNKTEIQNVTFYRKNFVLSPVQINKKIVEQGSNFIRFQLQASDEVSHIEELTLRYKLNNSQETESKKIQVNNSELNGPSRSTVVEIPELKSDQEYLIEMDKLVVEGQEITDTGWYLIGRTKKQLPSLEALEVDYLSTDAQFTVTPKNLNDADETITSIRYVVYQQEDYEANGKTAEIYASATVNGNEKNSAVYIGRTADMKDGSYVVVAYVMGNDGQNDYELAPIVSNPAIVGKKVIPTIQFSLAQAQQDSLNIHYEVFDNDDTLIFNSLTKPVFRLFSADETGNIIDTTPIKEVEIANKKEFNNQLLIDGLKSKTYYILTLTASYNLEDGNGIIAHKEIGRSTPFKTTEVKELTAIFTQKDAKEDQVTVNVKLDKEASVLEKAKLEVKDDKGNTTIQTIDLTEEMIEILISDKGLDIPILDLMHNNDYRVSIIEAYDSGENEVPIQGNDIMKTRKIGPVATTVLLKYDEKDSNLGALVTATDLPTVIDEDDSIKSITFQLFEAKALENDKDATPLAEKVIVTGFDSYTNFDLESGNLGRGKVYIIKAIVNWNDRFDEHIIDLLSDEIGIDQKLPEVEFNIVKRDATGVTVKTIIQDEDNILEGNKVTIQNGTDEVEAKDEQEVTIPANGAVTIKALGNYREHEGMPIKKATLQEKVLLPLTNQVPSITNNMEIDVEKRQLSAKVTAGSISGSVIATKQTIKHEADTVYSGFQKGADALAAQVSSLPNEDAGIWFNSKYDLAVATTLYYSENAMDNTLFSGQYNIIINDGEKVVSSTSGKVTTTGNRINASTYEISNATNDAKGNLTSIQFQNILTGEYLGINTGSIVDNEEKPYTFSMKRLANGSYVVMSENKYVNFDTGIVSNEKQASVVDLYSTNEATVTSTQEISLPELQVPTAVIDKTVIYDKRIALDFLVTDKDRTILKNAEGNLELYVTVYGKDGADPIKKVQLQALTDVRSVIDGLSPETEYTVKVEADYDELDGTGKKQAELASYEFKTLSAAPEIAQTTYAWTPNIYAGKGRKIAGTTNFKDESNILDTIDYRLYELTKDISYSTDVEVMAPILASMTPVTTYSSKEQTNLFDIYDEARKQRFVSGKTYIIAAYVKTTNPNEVPEFLGNVNKLTITAPTAPIANLKVESLTSKQADIVFSYNDPQGYILTKNNKPFNYLLTDTATGNPVTYVEGYEGSFTGTNASTWLKNFKGLNPSTGYTLTITGKYNNLNGQGDKPWIKSVNFTTSDEYVTSNPLIYILNGSNLTLKVANLNNGSATIKNSRMVLYQYNAATNTIGVEVANKSIPVASKYPIDINETFDISSLAGANEYLMARLEVTYDTDLGEENQSYTVQAIVYVGASAQGELNKANVKLSDNAIKVQVKDLPATRETYTVDVQNERGQVIATQEVNQKNLAERVTIKTDNQSVSRVQVKNKAKTIADYQTNQFEGTIMAFNSNEELILQAPNLIEDKTYTIDIQTKETTLAEQLLGIVKEEVVFDTKSYTKEQIKKQLSKNNKPIKKTYEVTGAMLKEGYSLPCSLNHVDVHVKESETGIELILQKMEVLK